MKMRNAARSKSLSLSLKILTSALIIIGVTFIEAAAQQPANSPLPLRWVQAPGPGGSRVQAMIEHRQYVFAGTYDGDIYRSEDQGKSWKLVRSRLGGIIYQFGKADKTLFAGTLGGLYRSTDDGQSWNLVSRNGMSGLRGTAAVLHNGKVFAGTDKGVYRSADNGINWTAAMNGLGNKYIGSLASLGQTLFAGTIYNGLYISTDDGENWQRVGAGVVGSDVWELVSIGNVMYAGCGGGAYMSSNGGQNWTELRRGSSSLLNIRSLAVAGNTLFAGTRSEGIYRLTNSGWVLADGGVPRVDVFAMTGSGSVLLAGLFGPGVYRSTNLGQNWVVANSGMVNSNISRIVNQGPNIFVSVRESGVFLADSKGQSWSPLSNGLIETDVAALGAVGSTLLAGTFEGIFRSTNNGQNWVVSLFESRNITSFAALGSTAFVGAVNGISPGDNGGVYVSSNNGQTWLESNNGLTNKRVYALQVVGNALYAGTADGLFVTTDRGQNWKQVTSLQQGVRVQAIEYANSLLLVGTESDGIFVSSDNGQSWKSSPTGVYDVEDFAVYGNSLYAASWGDGVYCSTDQGMTWVAVNDGLAYTRVNTLAVVGTTLWAGTRGGGIFISDLNARPVSSVSAASFANGELAVGAIVSAFGSELATDTQVAAGTSLPTQLAGTQLFVKDINGIERRAPLFMVSPGQINFLMPYDLSPGTATISVVSSDGQSSIGTTQISRVAPGIFSANSTGQGVAAALILRVRADGEQIYEPVANFDPSQQKFVALPIEFGPPTEQLFLILFVTGARNRSSLSSVSVNVGGLSASVFYAGAQNQFDGLDQINVLLPRALTSHGESNIELSVESKRANMVTVNFR